MSESFEELSARARRGELSRTEQEQLRWYLNASVEARLWHEAGCQADAEDAVLPGDHDAAQRVMQRALAGLAPKKQRKISVSVAAAAVLLVASVATASVAGLGYVREGKLTLPFARRAHVQKAARGHGVPVTTPAPAASAATPLPVVEPASSAAVTASPALSSSSKGAADTAAAASLFSAAALARREGNAAKAIALLDSLQDRYPGSREARLSDLTLGALHLKRGAAQAAFRHFENYSRSSGKGALAPEALWGEFQALSALGRAAEAKERLQKLVERYPSSTYGGVARAKLNAESQRP